jgi:UDPglucose 6-dehydrogenase/GDP-mannose 6-dehydrogenase
LGHDYGLEMRLLQAVLDINDLQPRQVIRLLESDLGSLAGRKVLLLGLAFKPGTDDVRESASLRIVRHIVEVGGHVIGHDPVAVENARGDLQGVAMETTDDWRDSLAACDAVVVATKWPEYAALTHPDQVRQIQGKTIVDARRMFRPEDFPDASYLTIGRRPTC